MRFRLAQAPHLLALLLFFGVPELALAVTYSNASTVYSWIDASAHTKLGPTTGGVYSPTYRFNGRAQVSDCGTYLPSIDDAISDNIPLNFTFMYGGVNFTNVRIMTNGRLQFNNNTTCGYGSPVTQLPYPYSGLNYTMRAYGGDLDPSLQSEISGYTTNCTSRNDCYVSYATIGTAPYRSFVVTWNNVPEWTTFSSASGNYNLQIVLQENGEFIYQYGSSIPGPGYTVGQVGWQVSSATDDYTAPEVGFPAAGTAIKFFIPRPVAEYRMEQPAWNGTANEVYDTSGNGRHGVRVGGVGTTASGKVCRGGDIPANTDTTISAIDTGIAVPATVGGVGTISFWFKPNGWTGAGVQSNQLFDATTADNEWFFLTKRRINNSNVTLRFVVRDSTGTTRSVETNNLTSAALSSGWVHIAVTWNFNALAAANSDRLRIYVNGALSATSAFSTAGTVSAAIGSLYIGDNRSAFIETNGTARSADGIIDEFRIYNYEGGVALVQRDMNQAGACLNHYAITTTGTPSVCSPVQPIQVTVKAHDNAHGLVTMPNNTTQVTLSASSSVTPSTTPAAVTSGGNWSLVSGYGTFSNGTADDGMATYIFNGEYQAVLSYQPTVSGDVYAHVTDGQIVESENTVILVPNCAPSSFNCVETGQAGGTGRLYTKLAGTAFGFDVFALKSDGSSTQTGYTGPVKIELVDGGVTCGTASLYQTVTASQTMTGGKYTIPASGAGSATVNKAYPNVRCRITDVTDTSLKSCSSDNFAIRPQQFTLSTTTALNPASDTLGAGTDFNLTADPGVSSSYTGTPVVDTANIVDHNSAAIAAAAWAGSFTPTAAPGGGSLASNFQYHDVGTVTLNANAVKDATFTAVDPSTDCVAGSTSNTLAAGKYGCNIGSSALGPLGRFKVDHFELTAKFTAASCGFGAANEFTYMDQDVLGLNLQLLAKSSGGTTLSRYTAAYSSLGTLAITGDNNGSAVSLNRLSTPSLAAVAWTSGGYASASTLPETHRFDARNVIPTPVMDGPYDLFRIKVVVSDPDQAKVTQLNGSAYAQTNATDPVYSPTTKIRYGRAHLLNAYGSELLPILVPVRAEYFSGGSWLLNTHDSCTSPGAASVVTSNPNPAGLAATVSAFPGLNGGVSNIKLTQGATKTVGSLDLALNLGATDTGSSCNANNPNTAGSAANLAWLQFAWCAGKSDPNARVKFGSPKAPYIYLRERY